MTVNWQRKPTITPIGLLKFDLHSLNEVLVPILIRIKTEPKKAESLLMIERVWKFFGLLNVFSSAALNSPSPLD